MKKSKYILAISGSILVIGILFSVFDRNTGLDNTSVGDSTKSTEHSARDSQQRTLSDAKLPTDDMVESQHNSHNSRQANSKVITDEQIAQWKRRDHEGLVEEVMPDGSIKVDLQGRFQHVITATKDKDGNLIIAE